MFNKIKSLFRKRAKDRTSQKDTTNHARDALAQDNPTPKTHGNSAYPITSNIMAWLDGQGWNYDHRLPDDGNTHHLIMGFTDREHEWTCVFRINEDNQLVSVFGVLEEGVPVSHYTAILMELAKVNTNIGFGGIEFDPTDGEVRAKIAFDAEFSALNDKSLGCYLQALAGLTELARGIMTLVLSDDEPSQFAGDYIDMGDEIKTVVNDERRTFFLPTRTAQ